jgi:hypothetical protein
MRENLCQTNFISIGETLLAIETYYLTSFRMRVEELVENIPTITVKPQEGEVMPLMDQEIQHCAAVIATAFLNPSKQN